VTMSAYKYNVGDRLLLKIGNRPHLVVPVIEQLTRKGPCYKIDWTEHGFNQLLNTVPIPEASFVGLAPAQE
jgi:hypothetical protein